MTELGYQTQLKRERRGSGISGSDVTEAIAGGTNGGITKMNKGSSMIDGGDIGSIDVIFDTQTGVTIVSTTVSGPNDISVRPVPPSPFRYNSPTLLKNIFRQHNIKY